MHLGGVVFHSTSIVVLPTVRHNAVIAVRIAGLNGWHGRMASLCSNSFSLCHGGLESQVPNGL